MRLDKSPGRVVAALLKAVKVCEMWNDFASRPADHGRHPQGQLRFEKSFIPRKQPLDGDI
jgi:hypothetical protein